MQESVLYIVLALLCVVIYLLIIPKKNKEEINNKEFDRLKDSLNSSINNMSTSFNTLSKDVTRDMTQALTKVDEKVGAFNKQVEDLNKSQASFSKILAGVKKYGTLAEFSLSSLLKDLLPASQYIPNVKMKEDTGENVEFAVKLQDGILVPIDSHWPVEKFQAIVDAEEAKDKKAIADCKDKLASAFRTKAKKVSEKYIPKHKSILRVIDRRYESNECFIRYDDSPDEDWLILIYLEDSDAKKGKIVVENKANQEKHETKSFETKEIFTYSDYLVDVMTAHIDRERQKKTS